MFCIYSKTQSDSNIFWLNNNVKICQIVSNLEEAKEITEKLAHEYIHSQEESGYKFRDENGVLVISKDCMVKEIGYITTSIIIKKIDVLSFHIDIVDTDEKKHNNYNFDSQYIDKYIDNYMNNKKIDILSYIRDIVSQHNIENNIDTDIVFVKKENNIKHLSKEQSNKLSMINELSTVLKKRKLSE